MSEQGRGRVGGAIVRLYAMAICVVVAWATYAALAYMVRTVFLPSHVPERLMGRAGQLTVTDLRQEGGRILAEPTERVPIGHYHGIDHLPQTDPYNTCAVSGCHSVLPHTKSVEVRAFANFHSTFLDCLMCHHVSGQPPDRMRWVSTVDGQPQDAPAILKLLTFFDTQANSVTNDPPAAHAFVEPLLAKAVKSVAGDQVLKLLRTQIMTSPPGSPVWRNAMAKLAGELPMHARGVYGAVLKPDVPQAQRASFEKALAEQTTQYLNTLDEAQRTSISEQLHTLVLVQPHGCVSCHGPEPGIIDYNSVGYSSRATSRLLGLAVAAQVQNIWQGRPFHLPQLSGENDAPR